MNEIEIRVTGRNDAAPAFAAAREQARTMGTTLGDEGRRAGQQWGEGFTRDASGRLRDARGRFAREGHETGREFGRGFEHESVSMFERLGSVASTVLGKVGQGLTKVGEGVTNASPFEKGATLAILTALPFAAQAAGAAITLGVGGAIAGLGIKAAASSAKVQASFAALKDHVSSDLRGWAKPFETTLIDISHVGRNTFDGLGSTLKAAFARLAPQVSSFAGQAGEALLKFAPMIDTLTVKFGPLLHTLGSRLPDLTGHLADALSKIGSAADPQSINMFIDAIDGAISATAALVVGLEKIGAGTAAAYGYLKDLGTTIRDAFGGGATAADTRAVAGAVMNLGLSARDAMKGVTGLKDAVDGLASNQLDARAAARNLEQAIDDASASFRKNGHTLDINTQKGRDNQAALDGIARSALEVRAASQKSGDSASKAMEKARQAFINGAVGAHYTRSEAEKLADKLGLVAQKVNRIPTSHRTTLRKSGFEAAQQAALSVARAIGGIHDKRVTITVATSAAAAATRQLSNMFKASGGIVGAAATGGVRSNTVLVGEQGPELVDLAPGSMVHTAGATRSMREQAAHHRHRRRRHHKLTIQEQLDRLAHNEHHMSVRQVGRSVEELMHKHHLTNAQLGEATQILLAKGGHHLSAKGLHAQIAALKKQYKGLSDKKILNEAVRELEHHPHLTVRQLMSRVAKDLHAQPRGTRGSGSGGGSGSVSDGYTGDLTWRAGGVQYTVGGAGRSTGPVSAAGGTSGSTQVGGGGSGGGHLTMQFNPMRVEFDFRAGGGSVFENAMLQWLRHAIRVRGGNVQTVLGH